MKDYDVLVIGGGISGLSAAALLTKRSLKVGVLDKAFCPGGSCGAFKRDDVLFDQGSSMLYGWGEKGFNAHRFLFNCLEQPITMIQHDLLYAVHYQGHRIRFFPQINLFLEELRPLFPKEMENLKRFYSDMQRLYNHVMVENPSYTTPDEIDKVKALQSMLRHPLSYGKFLSLLNKSAKSLLMSYCTDPAILKFFDKLTSTYCYTTVEESPAILSAVMFIDNHVGGSYYPAGSTLFLPGLLEKVIEEHAGTMFPSCEVVSILFTDGNPSGVRLSDGRTLYADQLLYSGTVWNLYGKLLSEEVTTLARRKWAQDQIPTYPSVVLYTIVDKFVVDGDTLPVEMLVGQPDRLDENEVTVYIPSVDDRTICGADEHVVLAIGPSLLDWASFDESTYKQKKQQEVERLLAVLERRFPSLHTHFRRWELATPRTIEQYTMKNGGAVAGPKQMLGQHMFKRLHIRTEWPNLFCCGESTVMGTGTPTVTTSGIAAANAILRQRGLKPFVYSEGMKNYVTIVNPPFTEEQLYACGDAKRDAVQWESHRCQFCEHPTCNVGTDLDVGGVMRRVFVGNFVGAMRLVKQSSVTDFKQLEEHCIRKNPVAIAMVCEYLQDLADDVL